MYRVHFIASFIDSEKDRTINKVFNINIEGYESIEDAWREVTDYVTAYSDLNGYLLMRVEMAGIGEII